MTWARDAEEAGALQWDGRIRSHHEAYHLSILDPGNESAWWLRYTVQSPLNGEPTSGLWGAHFSSRTPSERFALKTDFPARAFATQSTGLHIRVSKGELTMHSTKGGLRNPKAVDRQLRWNLDLKDPAPPLQFFPKRWMYARAWPPTKVLSPVPLARVSGIVEVGERRFVVKDGRAHHGHTWGSHHPDEWAWGFASLFREEPDAFVSALTAAPRGGGHPYTLLHYRDGAGQQLSFNAVRTMVRARTDQEPGVWTFEATRGRWVVSGRFSASLQKMVGVTYEDPEGTPRFCHHCGVGDATLEIWRSTLGRKRLYQTLTAKGTAAFEQGSMRPFEGVEFFL